VLVLLLLDETAAKKKKKEPEMREVSDDEPLEKAEFDAMSQVANSDKMKGMKFGKREVSADGKSGRITLEPESSEPEKWDPQHMISLPALRRQVDTEPAVFAFFMSSEEGWLSDAADKGKKVDEAAKVLLESDDQVTACMIDMHKVPPDQKYVLSEWGVRQPSTYKVFINGSPRDYRGRIDAEGIVSHMKDVSGSASTKLETAEALDNLLGNASHTVVVGVFGPAYQGASSREIFQDSARSLRDPGRLSFVEVSTKIANNAQRFSEEAVPFDTATSVFAVVRSPKWLVKGESAYATATDFRKITSFINENAWTTVVPFSEPLVTKLKGVRAGTKPPLLACLFLDVNKNAAKSRYIIKQYHKLVDALAPEVRERYSFAITHRQPGFVESWIHARFDRTTIDRTFYQADKFADEYVKDFTMLIADPRSARNWVSNLEAGGTPDRIKLDAYAPFLTGVSKDQIPHLAQGDDAAAAAGLKEMSMGFGGSGETMMEMDGQRMDPKTGQPYKRKKKKSKAKAADKAEL